MQLHREIGVGADGMPVAWRHVIVGQSLLADTPFASVMIKEGVDATAVEGVSDTHYNLPNFHLYAHHPKVNVPVLWWRSVGHTHTAFVMETLIDELADRAKMDPIASWRRKLPKGHAGGRRFRGLASDGERGDYAQERPGSAAKLRYLSTALHGGRAGGR